MVKLLPDILILFAIVSALYIALSQNLLRSTIAFFIELFSVSGILLSLGAEYLAMGVFMIATLGTIMILFFSKMVFPQLRKTEKKHRWGIAQVLGLVVGLSVGVAIGFLLLNPWFLSMFSENGATVTATLLGQKLLEEPLIFGLLAVFVLITTIGATVMVREHFNAH